MKTSVHTNSAGPLSIQKLFILNWYLVIVIWTQTISCFLKFNELELQSENPLQSEKLVESDLIDLFTSLQNYLIKYDHQIVCGDLDPKDETCVLAIDTLVPQYFRTAIVQGFNSRIWRQTEDGKAYGALLILNPKAIEQDEITQLIKLSTHQKEICAQKILGLDENEKLRYIRLHLGPGPNVPIDSRKQMLQQFVDESTQIYLCSEYSAAREHQIGIFVNKNAVGHFTKFNFELKECGSKLVEACANTWFKDRCLITKTVTQEACAIP